MTRATMLLRLSLTMGCWVAMSPIADAASGLFVVNQPWVRPAPAGGSTEAYMNLSSGDGAALVAVKSAAAGKAALSGAGAAPVQEISLPPGALIRLAPGKQRIALRRLAKELRLGDSLVMTLVFRTADGAQKEIPVTAVARLRSPIDDELRAHRHGR